MKRTMLYTAAAGALLALAACGGGGGDDAAALTMVPDEAVATSEAFTEWVGARRASETKDPLAMNEMTPPLSETAEPVEID